MPNPFKTLFQRPAVRKVLLPFTLGLILIALVTCSTMGA